MEPSTSSRGLIIPQDKLKIWKVFRDVGPEGEEILKTVRLAHPVNKEGGLIVTMTDETYFFLWDGESGKRVLKITRIPELCGVRVKEFVVDYIFLAVTEDGLLYSWITGSSHSFASVPLDIAVQQLGRFKGMDDIDFDLPEIMDLLKKPHRVLGAFAGEKLQQVVIAGGRVVALTVRGDVYQWGTEGYSSWEPVLIGKQHFEGKEVVSVACVQFVSLALASDGQLFQWVFDNKLPQKLAECRVRFKKITASMDSIFALSVNGALYRLGCPIPAKPQYPFRPAELVWANIFDNKKFQDIATSRAVDGVVVESKDNVRFAFSFRGRTSEPCIASFSPSCTSMEELLAEMSQSSHHTIRGHTQVKPRTVNDDMSNLWETKENADVTFSVGGKTITAHKCILTSRSDYFANMFNNAWKETKELSAIEIKDTTYDVFQALLFYIYNDKIYFPEADYKNIFGLLKLADYHCSIDIRGECEKILIRNINKENAIFLARKASSANASELEGNVLKFIMGKDLLDVNFTRQDLIELLRDIPGNGGGLISSHVI